jgi:hypothetical protein
MLKCKLSMTLYQRHLETPNFKQQSYLCIQWKWKKHIHILWKDIYNSHFQHKDLLNRPPPAWIIILIPDILKYIHTLKDLNRRRTRAKTHIFKSRHSYSFSEHTEAIKFQNHWRLQITNTLQVSQITNTLKVFLHRQQSFNKSRFGRNFICPQVITTKPKKHKLAKIYVT